jgi:hypothetical protein
MGVPDALPRRVGVFVGWWWTAASVRVSCAVEKSAEVVVPAGVGDGGWEGPNVMPSVRTFVLVVVALTAANPPLGGLAGGV